MAERGSSRDPLVAAGDRRESLDLAPYEEFLRLAREGLPGALVTVIGAEGSAPRGMGAAMTVRGDGGIVGTVGGGSLELLLAAHAREAIEDGRPRRLRYDFSGGPEQNLEKACLGKSEFFVQPTPSPPRLYIFGAGHIGLALAPMAAAAGFLVTLVDDRPGYPPPGAEAPGVRTLTGAFEEVIAGLDFDLRTYAVIVTYGHRQDEAVLRACLHRPWRYLGMIGSRAKVRQVFDAVGGDPASRKSLGRVHAPIGLDLGGRSPGEIAISIAAELQAVRHGRKEVRGMRSVDGPA
ncbi:MAG: XdhC/CoxI family protein [Acidobacteriota bacterium]|nr:XdhC/CoxI family protein [Acidobacteriota bacterium]MDQ7088007.1 XdhC/CoxI family protein [Acidobacteriota bacterium]